MLPGSELRTPDFFSPATVEMDSDSNYHIRISRSWADLSGVMQKAAKQGLKAVFYEHHKDDGCSRTHIHGFLGQSSIKVNTVKDWITRQLGSKPNKSDWMFSSNGVSESLITYMSKGVLEPVFYDGVEKTVIDEFRAKWIDHKEVNSVQKVEKAARYTVKDLQGDALCDYLVMLKDGEYQPTCADFIASASYQDDLVKSVTKTAKKKSDEGYFAGRIHVKFIREVCEYVIAEVYPDVFSRLVTRFWKF